MKSPVGVRKNRVLSQEEEEPPSSTCIKSEAEEEPPSRPTATKRHHLFSHVPENEWNDWKWQFRNRITTIDELAQFIPLSTKEQAQLKLVTSIYPLSITPYYLSLINSDIYDDPIRKQAIPTFEEVALAGTGFEDPLEEKRDSVVPGLVHRYPDRVLMVLTNLCPMLCRHCPR